jgi:2,3-bisphosphoglycerate-independent phosphoglycerate mutase
VITRGAGGWFELDSVLDARGISAALVAGCNTVAGLARVFGLSTVRSASFTAGVDTDVQGKLNAACEALRRQALVYVHIKATDLFSHDFQPEGKKAFIEKLDGLMHIVEDSGAAIALAADHSTDSNSGAHTADPIPAFFYVPGQSAAQAENQQGASINFGEAACRQGNAPRRKGYEFLLEIVDYLES